MTVDQDTLVGYALGHLTPQAEGEVTRHLEAHPEDAARVTGYLESLTDFALLLTPEPLPATGEADLLAKVRGSAPETTPVTDVQPSDVQPSDVQPEADPEPPPVIIVPTPPRRVTWWAAALGAAAIVAGLYFAGLTPTDPNVTAARELRQYRSGPGSVSYALAQEGQAEPLGTLVRLQDGRVFVALGAPPAEGRVYQAWNIGDAAASLGTFGERTFLSQAEVPVGNTFGLTLEPPGGSDQPTTTPLTLVEL